jgi:hypothetical protein
MTKRSRFIVAAIALVVAAFVLWVSVGWLWQKLLEMHGVH